MEEFLRRALHVEEGDEDIDLDSAPASGQDYLRRVMLEAKNCDAVVVANIDKKKLKAQTVKYSTDSGFTPAPEGYAPSKEWQKEQVAQFSELRSKLARQKALAERQGVKPKPSCELPNVEDPEKWRKFCFGDDSSPGTPPLLSIMNSMDQYIVEHLLEYHVDWLRKSPFTEHRGRWLYALLVKLEKPLKPEMGSLIRNLARICSTIRSKLASPDDALLSQLNLFICLVGRYFDQTDLADP